MIFLEEYILSRDAAHCGINSTPGINQFQRFQNFCETQSHTLTLAHFLTFFCRSFFVVYTQNYKRIELKEKGVNKPISVN